MVTVSVTAGSCQPVSQHRLWAAVTLTIGSENCCCHALQQPLLWQVLSQWSTSEWGSMQGPMASMPCRQVVASPLALSAWCRVDPLQQVVGAPGAMQQMAMSCDKVAMHDQYYTTLLPCCAAATAM